jgi:hypothetical protein
MGRLPTNGAIVLAWSAQVNRNRFDYSNAFHNGDWGSGTATPGWMGFATALYGLQP